MISRPLALQHLHQGLYQPNTANAYIYYGTAKKPTDQFGQALGEFIPDVTQNSLAKHIRKDLMPKVNQALSNTEYNCKDIDYVNQSPHPSLVIMRNDKQDITHQDIRLIRAALQSFIHAHNSQIKKQLPEPTVFSKNQGASTKDNHKHQETHRYNLRSNPF